MTLKVPRFAVQITAGATEKGFQDAAGATEHIIEALETFGWQGQEGGAGLALVRLFGRLTELTVNRLNQMPDKHLFAFLNEARVDLLPPRPASTELIFTLAADGPPFVRVPAGTQVTTVQTETQPEVIFETQRDLVVVPNALVKCIALDAVNFSDRTGQATGQTTSRFAPFQGEQERERILFLSDETLFTFSDAASRQAAEIALSFEFERTGNPEDDGWELEWLYWDGDREDWAKLKGAEFGDEERQITDKTDGFSQDEVVTLKRLPVLIETEVNGQSGLWIACKLTGGSARDHLPVLRSINASRSITDLSGQATVGAALSALQSGTAFVPLDPAGEFFPLGQHPGRLDTFYLRTDEALTKANAKFELEMALVGVTGEPRDTSELDSLTVIWEYYGAQGWTKLGTSSRNGVTPDSFIDTTFAFTRSSSEIQPSSIQFTVPDDCAEVAVNDQKGYWLRARVWAGSYDEPGILSDQWLPLKTHAPLISNLKVGYSGYTASTIGPRSITHCRSQVDGLVKDHSPALEDEEPFAPFCASEKDPALYLGFRQAFPVEEWIQLLLDVDEGAGTATARSGVSWEYWSGERWTALRVSDGSQGLSERGYLGFYGPSAHRPCIKFGQDAYWLRARPTYSHRRPSTKIRRDQTLHLGDGEIGITLDASGSRAYGCHGIARYVWRLESSQSLVADAGPERIVHTGDDQVTVDLDASGTRILDLQKNIAQYTWQLRSTSSLSADAGPGQVVPIIQAGAKENDATAYLKVVRLDTVPALNAVTLVEEILGSSDGEPDQRYSLLRPPVLPGAQIAVKEPDRPPDKELEQLHKELRRVEGQAQALLPSPGTATGRGIWVCWHQMAYLDASGPASRHFTLDPISGQVQFGDGEQGKIPPLGRDNIKAVFYRTHDGAKGNAAAGSITVLRNPSGDLANIKSVANPEAAAGGSGAETVEEVKRRGPQSLKHRGRAVAAEDFSWLALEASGEVAQAWCLPARSREGQTEAGRVTAVIIPESKEAKPMPSPALLRQVLAHLEDHALTNLKGSDGIYVRGPEYIEATVLAQVKPVDPAKSDEIELAILERLETFLHPLRGGPERAGWQLGRDVYFSEVCAEVEAVPGVDHVVGLRLAGSLQQHRLHLKKQRGRYPPYDLLVGSQVSTFDERIKLRLAEPVLAEDELSALAVYGFKVGDAVAIVSGNNEVLKENLHIAALSAGGVTFDQPFYRPETWPELETFGLMSTDGQLRLPIPEGGFIPDMGDEPITDVHLQDLQPGKEVSVVVGGRRDPALEFLPVRQVESCQDRIFVPEGHLIYSGSHDIEMVLE